MTLFKKKQHGDWKNGTLNAEIHLHVKDASPFILQTFITPNMIKQKKL